MEFDDIEEQKGDGEKLLTEHENELDDMLLANDGILDEDLNQSEDDQSVTPMNDDDIDDARFEIN